MGFVDQLQQYQANSKTKVTMADLTKMVNNINNKLACDDDCQRKKNIDKYRKKYLDEKRRLENAPKDLDNARKNYYTYAFGDDAYDREMMRLAKKEINELTNKLANDHQYNMKLLNDNISDYYTIVDNINILLDSNKDLKEQNEKLKKELDDIINEKNISDRKVVYEKNEVDKLSTYNYQLISLYWFITTIFLIIFFLKNMFMQPKNFIVISILLLYPFIMYYIAEIFSNIFMYFYEWFPKNMYIDDIGKKID
jgi:hypothetical protein